MTAGLGGDKDPLCGGQLAEGWHAEGLIAGMGRGHSGGLAALFYPPVHCVGVRHRGGALQKEQGLVEESLGRRARRASPSPPASQRNLAVSLPLSWLRGGERAWIPLPPRAVNALSPSLQGEPGPMAPKGEWPFSSPRDPLLLREGWSLGSPCLLCSTGAKAGAKPHSLGH